MDSGRVARLAKALGPGDTPRRFRAPGRVNLMGDHTDYNEGFVLPMAIDLDCLIAARPRADGRVRVTSLDVGDAGEPVEIAADGSDEPSEVEPEWGRYVAGVVRALAERGREPAGLEAALSSTVPLGSGLSSSAAIEVACALALCDVAGLELSRPELALACQAAERLATGVPSGVMDQLSSLEGREGAALLIDCRDLSTEPVPMPAWLGVVVVNSGIPRTLGGTAYAQRRAECEAVAAELGLRALRDARPEQVQHSARARHVVSENARVHAAARALAHDDVPTLGAIFAESHASLRDDFEVSTPELDALVDALTEAGAAGARLTGAGFGGCVTGLAPRSDARAIAAAAGARYREETGYEPATWVCEPTAGAGTLRAPSVD